MRPDAAVVDLPALEATRALGGRLAQALFPGAVVALVGPLGAGKTELARAIVAGLGGDPRQVFSPTFTLIHEYAARLPVYHFDAYRLRGDSEFLDLGVHEYLEGDGVCLIEWADRVTPCLPADVLRIELEVTGETRREARLKAEGPRHEVILLGCRGQ
jgi:tRNA threonylcarbamoyladenosine biosynthesis protein TsaE